ncbi:DUF4236 domain-containing protein [Flavilitoribacter nigricans]|uniref:SH3b domain-containing protein n=1 Tax=Flavilitoribacter nigricans (strain ATCC 23147 / DSM 23189 / NBRC 102662 / NCIMB 1420 / SS-2) TaxID=1122177 RepID=A0A2D0NI18_FLAN2|nr:DUF4236 domain-containing protein [Flavilitoribacter nigricans]PHN08145.1 hypothetical protein CRP01_02150 [Flavilitoribacter nigricans DSM 23189 = NBRC 102662]
MGFSFYRSKQLGPFKINVSTSGVGFSFGIKGARINFSPRGTFVNVGANGIYYRKKISSSSKNQVRKKPEDAIHVDYSQTYDNKFIGTINFEGLTDVDSSDIVSEIERKRKKVSMLKWIGVVPGSLIFFALLFSKIEVEQEKTRSIRIPTAHITAERANIRNGATTNSKIISRAYKEDRFMYLSEEANWFKITGGSLDSDTAYIHNSLITRRDSIAQEKFTEIVSEPRMNENLLFIMAPLFCIIFCFLSLWDKKRKRVEVYYAFDDHTEILYNNLIEGFNALFRSYSIWYYTHTSKTRNQKYNAGAHTLVTRHKISSKSINGKPAPFFKCNVSIPTIRVGNTEMFFFPERLILKRGKEFAGVMYKNLFVESKSTRFIESERVVSDAKIVDYTFKYVNKGGGADKRFKDNPRIPICLYSEYSISSNNGINEIIVSSKLGAMDQAIDAICEIQNFEEILN